MTLCELLGINLPIIQAPMAGASGVKMAAAVSNAGALGSLPCAMLDVPTMRKQLEELKAATPNPYNVNFFCHEDLPMSRAEKWQSTLAPYYEELGLDASNVPSAPARAPFGREFAEALAEFKPPVVSFHFGLPSQELLTSIRAWGPKVISSATTVDEAKWLEAQGVDAIIAQGVEAGGHRGMFLTDDVTTQVGTIALLPQIVSAVNVPVIAAGGIADACGVSAALALGAAGVQVGTAYLLCPEALIGPLHRKVLQSDAARHTALTNVFTGRPARGIVNRVVREVGPMSDAAPPFPLAASAVAPLRAAVEARGNWDFSPLWSGQNASGCRAASAEEVTKELAAGL